LDYYFAGLWGENGNRYYSKKHIIALICFKIGTVKRWIFFNEKSNATTNFFFYVQLDFVSLSVSTATKYPKASN